jgi:hypothetical protein
LVAVLSEWNAIKEESSWKDEEKEEGRSTSSHARVGVGEKKRESQRERERGCESERERERERESYREGKKERDRRVASIVGRRSEIRGAPYPFSQKSGTPPYLSKILL